MKSIEQKRGFWNNFILIKKTKGIMDCFDISPPTGKWAYTQFELLVGLY
jgi:hypothetical protein